MDRRERSAACVKGWLRAPLQEPGGRVAGLVLWKGSTSYAGGGREGAAIGRGVRGGGEAGFCGDGSPACCGVGVGAGRIGGEAAGVLGVGEGGVAGGGVAGGGCPRTLRRGLIRFCEWYVSKSGLFGGLRISRTAFGGILLSFPNSVCLMVVVVMLMVMTAVVLWLQSRVVSLVRAGVFRGTATETASTTGNSAEPHEESQARSL